MRTIKFSSNWNGKLCNDVFTTIRLYDYDKYPIFEKYEVHYKNKVLGIVECEAQKAFKYGSINDITALVDCGHAAPYLTKLLKNFYPQLTADSLIYMIVFRWKKRNAEATQELFDERWQKLRDANNDQETFTTPTPTLFENE